MVESPATCEFWEFQVLRHNTSSPPINSLQSAQLLPKLFTTDGYDADLDVRAIRSDIRIPFDEVSLEEGSKHRGYRVADV